MRNILLIFTFGLLCSCSTTTGFVIDKRCIDNETIRFTILDDKDTINIETEMSVEMLNIDYYDVVKIKNDKVIFLKREI
jgi:enhancing lycopene biosynthesis protein 2